MRKNKYLVLIILLLVVCSGLVTYALFRSNKSGNANVNAARWNVVFKNGEEEISNNFDISLNNATWTNPLGNVASGKIAPGSQATFYITIDATNTETSVDYTVEVDESFNVSDFEVTLAEDSGTIPYSTVEGAMIKQIPIKVIWNGNINDNDDKNIDDLLKKSQNISIPIKITAAQKLLFKYIVNFIVDGNIISTKEVFENGSIDSLPSEPSKQGFSFLGWFTLDGTQISGTELLTSNENYYAHWTEYLDYSRAGELVYYDPVSNNTCNSTTYTGNNTCYKWRIISVGSYSINMQLDHGFDSGITWNNDGNSEHGPVTALTSLQNITSTWIRVDPLTYEYNTSVSSNNYGRLNCLNGICEITKTGTTIGTSNSPLRARLLTVDEVAKIINNPSWSLSNQINLSGISSWLYENFGSQYSYWFLTPSNIDNKAYEIDKYGNIFVDSVNYGGADRSIRPVININKNISINFDYNDGSTPILTTNNEFYSNINLPENPTRQGYTFMGWYDENNNLISSSVKATSSVTYYAHWGFTVTFNSNGGSNVSSINVMEGNTLSSIPISTKANSDFLGWFDEYNNELTVSTQILGNKTYTARWLTSDFSNAGYIIYYDPISSNECNSSTYNLTNINNGTSTCYKWRLIKDTGDNIVIQLDHNLINNLGFTNISTNVGSAMQSLASATSGWTRVFGLNYTYDSTGASTNYGVLSCSNGNCTISNNNTQISNVKARLITGEEVAQITKSQTSGNTAADNWSLSNQSAFYFSHTGYYIGTLTSGSGNKNLSWLIENTSSDSSTGATNNIYGSNAYSGYLTLSPRPNASNFYLVHSGGYLGYANGSDQPGARPVITIDKPTFNVTFVYNNGIDSNLVKSYGIFNSLGTLPIPSEKGGYYIFDGWNTKEDGTGTYVNENTIVDFSNLYAIWHDGRITDFAFNSSSQTPKRFTAPYTGTYKLETWGAQGGNSSSTYIGGKGGYSTGTIELEQGDEIYVVVGGQGSSNCTSTCNGGYNGGGNSGIRNNWGTVGAGGGATHIGTFNSTLESHGNSNGLYIVAGAGGGSINQTHYSSSASGGIGGGLEGGIPTNVSSSRSHQVYGTGGNQIQGGNYSVFYNSSYTDISDNVSKGKFGKGGTYASSSELSHAGGGGGYYGGGAGYLTGGTGGSSYIGGVNNGSTIDGAHEMPSPSGGIEIGHSGNGYARITFMN